MIRVVLTPKVVLHSVNEVYQEVDSNKLKRIMFSNSDIIAIDIID